MNIDNYVYQLHWRIAGRLQEERLAQHQAYCKTHGYIHCNGYVRESPWTQANVARKIDISGALLCMWENGRNKPQYLEKYFEWAKSLNLDFIEILEEEFKNRC